MLRLQNLHLPIKISRRPAHRAQIPAPEHRHPTQKGQTTKTPKEQLAKIRFVLAIPLNRPSLPAHRTPVQEVRAAAQTPGVLASLLCDDADAGKLLRNLAAPK